jgi:UDP-N-acetylmuramoylalanine--D-glutamate ligase
MVSADAYAGREVVIMGLGLHGGGAAAARFFAEHGARVTVTDLQDEKALTASIASVSDLPIRFVLGRHDPEDFSRADFVIKNPAVPRSAPLLGLASRIETDISVFLEYHRGPVVAVTGTKGKSSTASLVHHLLLGRFPGARLGGNITVSPLGFLDTLTADDPVVLELSSFQLGDLRLTAAYRDTMPPFPVAVITNLMPDHQDYYPSMDAYWADKALIAEGMNDTGLLILPGGDEWSRGFSPDAPASVLREADLRGEPLYSIVEENLRVPGAHMRLNALTAAAAADRLGVPIETIGERLQTYAGIPHRLEDVGTVDGVRCVNDSAATIAEAALAAVQSFDAPVHLIAGGSEKRVGLSPFARIAELAASIHLLDGSATPAIETVLRQAGAAWTGPHGSLRAAFDSALEKAAPGEIILLSPGCASFGMFRNEFDRGEQFRSLVNSRKAW